MTKNNLHSIKNSGFKVPDGYFDQVETAICNDISLREKIEASGFTTPKGYFEHFEDHLLGQLPKEENDKAIPLYNRTKVIFAIAIAACLVLMLSILFNTTQELTFDTLETAAIENYLEEEDYTDDDLATLFMENELSTFDFIEVKISEDTANEFIDSIDIEDYILN
ncbi:hypothetical protein ESY86_03140 [Subsaximicrobium wynnwilliamsii]|uniref:Uncharacterized protein n=1 Tax=Subsaximicrobium wynnwilliamsii TaxID=291179 RepID=A0A5C6ZK63_9FLAO|nr:hypothetical protein [Subsaximicrobium wynnwilliamsii]TXD84706.1 hypothetical protein ESY87_02920 [Subsaximicrobium wynnwilliamsii]TXD90376.1 hypothetical protein ESY86_03140 [Subsaximicrobium wynnwilliamsii]TXE04852.1 hypothetical protein ESY88_01450 [Subsaximicrobium wynnwilliamsii]